MSAGLVTGVVLLGALAGWAAVPLARRFTAPGVTVATVGRAHPVAAAGPPALAQSDAAHRPGADGDRDIRPRPVGRLGMTLTGMAVFGGLAVAHGASRRCPRSC
ncbi:hypothetical protein ONA91_05345 [Micromonospora sp. DR5-3]|uniref:hypothetical protein n=1 Tax=unclassified Micromonospora TaxID=2617518 RepID=UPI00210353BE|nr:MULTISPECIES: hypothetical protein [unclassified Micromonospora]MCW3813879.1 hypothetical protein [Micromonospora sp. DR5-3]